LNHKVLLSTIKSRTRDPKLLKLIYKLLKAGYINPNNLVDSKLETDLGTPQGSIISPLMANIYFNKLDQYVIKDIIPKFNQKGTTASGRKPLNEEYQEATSI